MNVCVFHIRQKGQIVAEKYIWNKTRYINLNIDWKFMICRTFEKLEKWCEGEKYWSVNALVIYEKVAWFLCTKIREIAWGEKIRELARSGDSVVLHSSRRDPPTRCLAKKKHENRKMNEQIGVFYLAIRSELYEIAWKCCFEVRRGTLSKKHVSRQYHV